jgi:hypothetical protein
LWQCARFMSRVAALTLFASILIREHRLRASMRLWETVVCTSLRARCANA